MDYILMDYIHCMRYTLQHVSGTHFLNLETFISTVINREKPPPLIYTAFLSPQRSIKLAYCLPIYSTK